jgi:hypothetical protein
LFKEVIEGGHCQRNHNGEQVKDLEEAPEESPLAHEGMPLLDVLVAVLVLVEVDDLLPLNVKLGVLNVCD